MTLKLKRTHRVASSGVELLNLSNGHESIVALSGVASKQNFRSSASQVVGALEPIPEGVYDLGPLEWAGRPGDYKTVWSGALGPVWVTIDPARAIGFHLDANAATAPGTAGCVGFPDMATLKRFVSWFTPTPPTRLVVDWGLGTVKGKR